jgi:hypothetical protein
LYGVFHKMVGSGPRAPFGRQMLVDSPTPSRIGTSSAMSASAISASSARNPSSL